MVNESKEKKFKDDEHYDSQVKKCIDSKDIEAFPKSILYG